MIPDEYLNISEDQLRERISGIKKKMGRRLVILGHHYQRDEVIDFADYRGDSLGLSQKAAEQRQAEFIVFCGVHFMAEAADIISSKQQTVHLPDLDAGCPLANFADLESVTTAWEEIHTIIPSGSTLPITYINSSADLKAFCGENNGTVCTSSNALNVLKWAFNQSEKVFFFPDQHLGRNTANKLGITQDEQIVWDPDIPFGGNSPESIRKAKVILWKGHCHVHTFFNINHILNFREKYPQGKIIVHPECNQDVVNAADADGSTSAIIRYVQNSLPGTVIGVGTELNLVNRLNHENPDKQVIPLARSLCPNMFKINLYNLCWTLENLGKVNIVHVPDEIGKNALIALERMLEIH